MNRRSLFWIGLAALLVAVAVVTSGQRNETGHPLDPDSTDSLGTLALVELLERFGPSVIRDLPRPATATTLMLADQLTEEQRHQLEDWVSAGGTVVVTDPSSPLVADLVFPAVVEQGLLSSGTCTVPGLEQLTLEAGSFLLYQVDGASQRCFGQGEGSFVHVAVLGEGRIVSLGGGLVFTNQNLDEADNAVLAVELLLPADAEGSTVAVLFDPILTPGSRTLSDLIPSSARWAALQLLVAFGVYVLWRSRRFGSPVYEPQPVELPGSLLVRAASELHRRSGGYANAGATMGNDFRQRVRQQLKVSPELPLPDLAALVSEKANIDRSVVRRALITLHADNRQELIDLMAAIDAVDLALAQQDHQPVGDST